MATAGGAEDLVQLALETFQSSAKDCVAGLETAETEDGFYRLAHRLKGAADSVGAVQVAAAARQAEAAGDAPNGPAAKAAIEEARKAVALVNAVIRDTW